MKEIFTEMRADQGYNLMTEVKLSITPIEGIPDNYRVVISGSGFEHAEIRRPDGKYGAMTRCSTTGSFLQ